MSHSKKILATMATVMVLGGTGVALAAENEGGAENANEMSTVLNAKTSLTQAIAAAEAKTGGKAVDTGLENRDGTMAYEVDVAKDGKMQRVRVALDTGQVIDVMAADMEDGGKNGQSENGEDGGNGSSEQGENGEDGGN